MWDIFFSEVLTKMSDAKWGSSNEWASYFAKKYDECMKRGFDITTKNPKKFERYHKNFQNVREKIKEVEERDHIRNFQPPISGEEIMKTFNLQPCREIGQLKEAIKEAILEGDIPNDYKASYDYMLQKGEELGLKIT